MNYVHQSLADGEKVIHIGKFHWLYTFSAVMNALIGLFIAVFIVMAAMSFDTSIQQAVKMSVYSSPIPPDASLITKVRSLHPGVRLASFFALLLGLLSFANMMVIQATTEIAVTTNRIIYKRGVVARYVGEISVDRIEGVNVIQSIMGRILDYGRLVVRGMGVGEVFLPTINNPVLFRKAIDKARAINRRNNQNNNIV